MYMLLCVLDICFERGICVLGKRYIYGSYSALNSYFFFYYFVWFVDECSVQEKSFFDSISMVPDSLVQHSEYRVFIQCYITFSYVYIGYIMLQVYVLYNLMGKFLSDGNISFYILYNSLIFLWMCIFLPMQVCAYWVYGINIIYLDIRRVIKRSKKHCFFLDGLLVPPYNSYVCIPLIWS